MLLEYTLNYKGVLSLVLVNHLLQSEEVDKTRPNATSHYDVCTILDKTQSHAFLKVVVKDCSKKGVYDEDDRS